mmetsp:Transcript_39267/g.83654  ORF Transcript_39267/g.83654 Transcript_39267/m.83654 type:complete len:95 (-) Transcript_39267:9-293(-)
MSPVVVVVAAAAAADLSGVPTGFGLLRERTHQRTVRLEVDLHRGEKQLQTAKLGVEVVAGGGGGAAAVAGLSPKSVSGAVRPEFAAPTTVLSAS